MAEPGPQGGSPPPSPWAYATVGIEVVVPVLVLMFAGYWIDGRLSSGPWFLLIGALAGIALGLYGLLRRLLPQRGRGGTER